MTNHLYERKTLNPIFSKARVNCSLLFQYSNLGKQEKSKLYYILSKFMSVFLFFLLTFVVSPSPFTPLVELLSGSFNFLCNFSSLGPCADHLYRRKPQNLTYLRGEMKFNLWFNITLIWSPSDPKVATFSPFCAPRVGNKLSKNLKKSSTCFLHQNKSEFYPIVHLILWSPSNYFDWKMASQTFYDLMASFINSRTIQEKVKVNIHNSWNWQRV